MTNRATRRAASILAAGVLLAGCGGESGGGDGLSGKVTIDGSSTVYPVTEAMAEEFQRANRGVRVTVGVSGTGGGFKKFCRGETDVSDASRPITETERELCAENRIDYVQVPVALDGLTVAVHPENDWVSCVTTDELERIWQPNSSVERWSDVREGWPDEEINLFGPGTDSGTFDYFTEAIMGEEDASRSDYSASEDDNVILMGIANDRYAMGYFGFAYYVENRDMTKALAIDDGSGCVAPSVESVASGEYQPLSRPLFIYVRQQALERNEVRAFVDFYLGHATELVPQVGYVPLASARYDSLRADVLGGSSDGAPAGTSPGGDTASAAGSDTAPTGGA